MKYHTKEIIKMNNTTIPPFKKNTFILFSPTVLGFCVGGQNYGDGFSSYPNPNNPLVQAQPFKSSQAPSSAECHQDFDVDNAGPFQKTHLPLLFQTHANVSLLSNSDTVFAKFRPRNHSAARS